eukprot:3999840-Amphidinium_carterae.1
MEELSIRSQRGLRTWVLFPFWDGGVCAKEKLHDSPTGKSGMQHFLMICRAVFDAVITYLVGTVGFSLPQQRSTADADARSRSGLLQHKQPRRKLPQLVPEFAQVRNLDGHEVTPFCKLLSSVGGAPRPLYGIWWTPEEFDAKAVEVTFPWDLDSLLHDEVMNFKTMAFVLER